ncbi:MAG: RNA polymerase sigma-70 factor [Ferruginibacter sp.]
MPLTTLNNTSEKELLQQVAEGNEISFGKLFQLYGDSIHAHIFALIKVQAPAEDLVQDTFLKVWLHRDQLPSIENFRLWLFRIGYNLAFSYLRSSTLQVKGLGRYAQKYGLQDVRSHTQEYVESNELNKVIATAIQSLPEQQQNIYLLSRQSGLKIEEIATQLGLSPQTIKNNIGKALQVLRQAIELAGFAALLTTFPWLV